jgi:hypothetical protein
MPNEAKYRSEDAVAEDGTRLRSRFRSRTGTGCRVERHTKAGNATALTANRGGHGSLKHPEPDEHRKTAAERGADASNHKHTQPEQKPSLAAKEVSDTARRDQQRSDHDRVSVENPAEGPKATTCQRPRRSSARRH